MEKKRLDVLLVEQGFFKSRQASQAAIMAGRILVNGEKLDKAGSQISINSNIKVLGEDPPYVSRGGLKLEKALAVFSIDLKGKRIMDVGASTGGFTDCALQSGALEVIAVDVGYGQLAWKLRQDSRVKVLERTNIRYLTLETIGNSPVDVVVADVSFISLRLILDNIFNLAKENSDFILLIKPQFEVGRDRVGKKGVVKDLDLHKEVILEIMSFSKEIGLKIGGLDFSPITGPEGNIEYLLWLIKGQESNNFIIGNNVNETVSKVVNLAHESLS